HALVVVGNAFAAALAMVASNSSSHPPSFAMAVVARSPHFLRAWQSSEKLRAGEEGLPANRKQASIHSEETKGSQSISNPRASAKHAYLNWVIVVLEQSFTIRKK
ncbi:hypothetical protein, partial [Myxococcus sp. CA040A]|uniref:hypothetical protein n=1 Tax=Myxococcus sp. CA040A TaxID=2741738 RepID=UPI001C2D5AF3